MLAQFYDLVTQATMELQQFGQNSFELGCSTPLGFLGVAVQDTRTFLVGLQNILAIHLRKPPIALNLASPEMIDTPNDFLSAMKGVHRYFFISVQSAVESAAQEICENRLIKGLTGEKALRRALRFLPKEERNQWRQFYEGLKVIRNECAHPSSGIVQDSDLKKVRDAGLDFLVSGRKTSINCNKYLPVAKRAHACIAALQCSRDLPTD
ncbi:MAG: hypothetical protein AB1427_13035 [Thermodesulfobacteriota bacterium]